MVEPLQEKTCRRVYPFRLIIACFNEEIELMHLMRAFEGKKKPDYLDGEQMIMMQV